MHGDYASMIYGIGEGLPEADGKKRQQFAMAYSAVREFVVAGVNVTDDQIELF